MDPTALVDDATADRLRRHGAGADTARYLRVADLEVDRFGVLDAEVRHVHALRSFTRKDGRAGSLRRVTLGDGTGEVDLVLWGEEAALAVDGPLRAGAHVRLHGPTVKAGFRGGVELHLGGGVVAEVESERTTLAGTLVELGQTRVVGEPPAVRFQADLVLDTDAGRVQAVLWDDAVKTVRAVLPGARVVIEGATAHPSLDGWFVADGATVHTG